MTEDVYAAIAAEHGASLDEVATEVPAEEKRKSEPEEQPEDEAATDNVEDDVATVVPDLPLPHGVEIR